MQSLLIIADKAILEGLERLPEWLPVPDHGDNRTDCSNFHVFRLMSELIHASTLGQVGQALPVERYFDPQIYALEMEHLFRQGPGCWPRSISISAVSSMTGRP